MAGAFDSGTGSSHFKYSDFKLSVSTILKLVQKFLKQITNLILKLDYVVTSWQKSN